MDQGAPREGRSLNMPATDVGVKRPPYARQHTTGPDRARPGPVGPCGQVARQALNELPQPQPPEAFGFLNVNPAPIMVVT
jgi:hypothetical protein